MLLKETHRPEKSRQTNMMLVIFLIFWNRYREKIMRINRFYHD